MMEEFYEGLSLQTGLGKNDLPYVVSLALTYPLSFIHRSLPSSDSRHLFSFITGLLLAANVLGKDWMHAFITSTVVYYSCKYFFTKWTHIFVFVFSLIYLSMGHMWRQYHYYLQYTLDWTLPQMLLTIKLTAFAYCVYDGAQSDEKLSESQKEFRIRPKEFPSILEWYSYVFCFATFLTGPTPEFQEYRRFTDRTIFKEYDYKLPSFPLKTVLTKVGMVVLAIVMHSVYENNQEIFCSQESYLTYPIWYRAGYMFYSVELGFCKYYFAWYSAEAVTVAMGLGYNGKDKDGNLKWDRLRMTELLKFKFCTSSNDMASSWNIPAAIWLKRYVFVRLLKIGYSHTFGVVSTFLLSGIWHGFYPGYYLFFGSMAFFKIVSETYKANIKPLFMKDESTPNYPLKYFYDISCWICLLLMLDYCTAAFRVLSFQEGIALWRSVYYFPHVVGLVSLVFFGIFGKKKSGKKPGGKDKGKREDQKKD